MDRRIQLQRRSLAQNSFGEQIETFTTYATVWAEKLDARGREFFAAQQFNGELTTRFRIRWRGDVQMTDQIVYDGLNFNITQIAEIGRKSGHEIFATAAKP